MIAENKYEPEEMCSLILPSFLLIKFNLLAMSNCLITSSDLLQGCDYKLGVCGPMLKFKSAVTNSFICSFVLISCGGNSSYTSNPFPENNIQPPANNPVLLSDISYGKTDRNKLDIYQPGSVCEENRPTVFYIHGGGFVGGDKKSSSITNYSNKIKEKSWNFVSINYRLVRHNPVLSPTFQAAFDGLVENNNIQPIDLAVANAAIAALEDTTDALNFLNDNADEYCIDMSRLGFWGVSAGAYTVLGAGYSLDNFGVDIPQPDVIVNFYGDLFQDSHLDFMEAPFITIHGDNDPTVDYQHALDLAAQADLVSVPYTFITIANGGHGGFDLEADVMPNDTSIMDTILSFLEAHLIGGTADYDTVTVSF